MNLIELIGFVVSLVALGIIAISRSIEERRRRRDPEAYEREQEQKRQELKKVLRQMHIEDEEDAYYVQDNEEDQDEEIYTPPPRKIAQMKASPSYVPPIKAKEPSIAAYHLKSGIEERQLVSTFEKEEKKAFKDVFSQDMQINDAYEIRVVSDISTGSKVLKSIPSMKEMVILHEILDRPKALKYERPVR